MVVNRIINAIRQEEALVVIPWRGVIVYFVSLLPLSISDSVGAWLGIAN